MWRKIHNLDAAVKNVLWKSNNKTKILSLAYE